MLKRTAIPLLSLIMLAWIGTAQTGCSTDDECVGGKACTCSGDCTQTCGGSGASCTFHCPDGATCHFSCPGGSCTAYGENAASVTLDCPGDSCTLDCQGADAQACQVTSCTTACALDCGAATTCQNSCDMMGGCTTN